MPEIDETELTDNETQGQSPPTPRRSPATPSPSKAKRGHYRKVECPYCHSMVGNLGNHVKLKHPADAADLEVSKDTLLGKRGTPATPSPPVYYCVDCKAKLRKGESPCWHCGATLNWEGIA